MRRHNTTSRRKIEREREREYIHFMIYFIAFLWVFCVFMLSFMLFGCSGRLFGFCGEKNDTQ